MNLSHLQSFLSVARGDHPADLLLKNGRVINTLSGEIEETGVAIFDGLIAGLGDYSAKQEIDLSGAFLAPSFIDGHIHIESSLLSPQEFARAVVPRGTGAVVCDPHEIANVCGLEGIRYLLDSTEDVGLDVYVMLPSCVPATHMETAGAVLDAEALRPLLNHPRVLGIAEVMNFPGVIMGDPDVLRKIELADGRPVDGHAPGVRGKQLNAYVASGIGTDHECTAFEEAQEKLRRGIAVLIREGSTARNLAELLPLVKAGNAHRFAFVSDDRHADDLLSEGHLNATLSRAVSLGLDPITAIQMVTSFPAAIFGLRRLGAIVPGRRANLVELADLKQFRAKRVWRDGQLVAEDGTSLTKRIATAGKGVTGTMHLGRITRNDLAVPATGKIANVIVIIPDQIVTDREVTELPVEAGTWLPDSTRDIVKLVVMERHGVNGNIGRGFVRGLGLKRGAIASTVAHDSHNLICAGTDDTDMICAIESLKACGGGLAVAADGKVLAQLPLPIAGLMSDAPVSSVVAELGKLHQVTKELGCPLAAPFMALSFLALPVIPHLKLTDRGLVDVDRFCFVESETH